MKEIKKKVEELKRELEERGFPVKAVYLFGSHARGDFVAWSDLDLVIVSDAFEGIPFTERLSLLYKLFDEEASLVPLTEEELKRKVEESVVLRDASKYWIKVV